MLSNYEFVWAGYDIAQTRYIEDCIGARVVSNDLFPQRSAMTKVEFMITKITFFLQMFENQQK